MAGVINAVLLAPLLGAPHLLDEMASNADTIGFSTLLNIIMAGAVIAIAVVLYPILKRTNPVLAAGYLMARTVEGLILALAGLGWLALVSLGQSFVHVEAPDSEYILSLGQFLNYSSTLAFTLAAEITFGVTAIILNIIFIKAKLVPKWISVWGLIGGVLILVLGVMKVLGAPVANLEAAFTAPIALNEMVLAVWLIVKGLQVSETSI